MTTCRTCRYCIPISADDGYCHRGPPTLVPPNGSAWPPVNLSLGWCGEYKVQGPVPNEHEMRALQLRCIPMTYEEVAKAMDVTLHAARSLAGKGAKKLALLAHHPEFHLVEKFAPLKSGRDPDPSMIKWKNPDGSPYRDSE